MNLDTCEYCSANTRLFIRMFRKDTIFNEKIEYTILLETKMQKYFYCKKSMGYSWLTRLHFDVLLNELAFHVSILIPSLFYTIDINIKSVWMKVVILTPCFRFAVSLLLFAII